MARSVKSFSLVRSVPSTSETTSAILVMSRPDLSDDVIDDGLDRRVDRDGDRTLVGFRPLQRPELAVEQPRRHEMPLAAGKPLGDQGLAAVEKDEANIVPAAQQHATVGAFQRRAGDHEMVADITDPLDLVRNRLQPWPAVFVGERMACAHLGDVACGVKAIAVFKRPSQAFGKRGGYRAFARTRYAHHDQGTGRRV